MRKGSDRMTVMGLHRNSVMMASWQHYDTIMAGAAGTGTIMAGAVGTDTILHRPSLRATVTGMCDMGLDCIGDL